MSTRINKKLYIAVGIGGMIGAMSRFGISTVFAAYENFPVATLTANLIGCFLLSFLLNQEKWKQRFSLEIRTGVTTGIIGAFTTYSTFAVETFELWQGNIGLAMFYIGFSIVGGLASCYFGYKLARRKQVPK